MRATASILIEAEPPRLLDALSRSSTAHLGVEWDGACGRTASRRTLSSMKPSLVCGNGRVSVQVFGTLFVSDGTEIMRRLEAAASAAHAAETLVALAWGGYAAFLEDEDGAHVLRDPSGAMPLYIARFENAHLASTHITPELLRDAGIRWQVDIPTVAKLLANPPAAAYLSGLVGMEIVVPGRLANLGDPGTTSPTWSPSAIARRRTSLAPEALQAALDGVLAPLADDGVNGAELSGGFDSSVVFSSLAGIGADPRPFNFATTGKGGDEEGFANDVATRWGIPLRTYSSGHELPDYRAFDGAEHGVQPILHGLDSLFAEARQDMIDEERITRVMTGQGGDALFFRLPTRLVALDRRRELGWKSLLDARIVDDARRANSSIWSVMATALGHRTGDDRPVLDWNLSRMLGPAAGEHLIATQPRHPWLDDADDLPPAKQFHLMMLSHCQLFHGPRLFAPTAPVLHPLLTQPLIELTLACPTYELQTGRIDRGLARSAFGDRLPRSVLHRRSKGEASDHYARAVLHNRDWLRDHLLGGRLNEAELLNGRAVEHALEPEAMRLGTDYRAFVQYASVESWLRYWG